MKPSSTKSASSSSRTTGDRGSASSGSKTASNAKSAQRQSRRAADAKSNDTRGAAEGTAEKGSGGKLRS